MDEKRDNKNEPVAGVREAVSAWLEYRQSVDRLERDGKVDPIQMLARHTEFAWERIVQTRRVLRVRFGLRVGEMSLFEPTRIDVSGARVDLADQYAVAELGDALHRLYLCEDIRLAINRAITKSRQHGETDHAAATAACVDVIHVLRSRPMYYGVFSLLPDETPNEPAGLRAVRAASVDVLAGWVRTQLRLGDWSTMDGQVGANRLRAALVELALPGESIEDAMLREIPAETVAQFELLVRLVETDPDQVVKWKLTHKSLRNRVAGGIESTASVAEKWAQKGIEVSSLEAVEDTAEQTTLADEQTRVAETLDEIEAAASLSSQQRRIIHLARQGLTNGEIAEKISATPRNVETQRSTAIGKMRAVREAADD